MAQASTSAAEERVLIVDDALPHRRGEEGKLGGLDELSDLLFGTRVGSSLANDDERPFCIPQHVNRPLHVTRIGLGPRRFGATFRNRDVSLFYFRGEKIIRKVEIGCPGSTIDRRPYGLLAVEGNPRGRVGPCRVLRVDPRQLDLRCFLKGAHSFLIGIRRSAEQNHRPAVFLGIRESGDPMDHPGTRDGEACARASREVADGPGRIARGLLIPHADELDPLGLRCCGDSENGKPDDSEHVNDALLFEAAGDEGISVDFGHGGTPTSYLEIRQPDWALLGAFTCSASGS